MSRIKNAPGKGCLFLFALPFVAVGVLSIARALWSILSGNYRAHDLIIEILFGMVFGGVGVMILLGTRYGGRIMKREMLLRERHPDEPWMWRGEWAENRITGPGRGAVAFTWFFAIFWNLISWTVIGANFNDLMARKNWTTLFILLFPLIGIGLIIWALRASIRWRKFGTSILRLDSVPAAIGDRLAGTIQTGMHELPQEGVTLTLNCIRKVTRNGRRSSSSENILWQEELRVGREQLFRSPAGFGIPVDIPIPDGCEETARASVNVEIFWRLHAKAAVSGVDFDTSFIVPVFTMGKTKEETIPEENTTPFSPTDGDSYEHHSGKVRIRRSPTGGTEFYFGPLRNPGIAMGMALFLVTWGGSIWFMVNRGGPWILTIIFGIVAILVALFLVSLLAGTSRVVADQRGIRIHRGVFGLTLRTKEIPRPEVEDVILRISMQRSPTRSSAGRAYYSIDVICRDGSKRVAGRNVGDKREASFIAGEMKRILGISQKVPF